MINDGTQTACKIESIKNTVYPEWVIVFVLEYKFGIPLEIGVDTFDEVQERIIKATGSVIFDVQSKITAKRGNKGKILAKSGGTAFAHFKKFTGSGIFNLEVIRIKLNNLEGLMRKSDPFMSYQGKMNQIKGRK